MQNSRLQLSRYPKSPSPDHCRRPMRIDKQTSVDGTYQVGTLEIALLQLSFSHVVNLIFSWFYLYKTMTTDTGKLQTNCLDLQQDIMVQLLPTRFSPRSPFVYVRFSSCFSSNHWGNRQAVLRSAFRTQCDTDVA